MTLSTYDLIFDPQLLGTGWEAASFNAHRALTLGAFGGSMTKKQRAMFAEMTGGRAPLKRPPNTLVIIKSRRVAGTRLAVAISQALALRDWPRAPGERPTVRYLAVDRTQSSIAFGYAKGGFAASPLLSGEVANSTAHRIELSNGNALEIGTSDDGAVRGITAIAFAFDEAAYIPGLDALLAAARPALATTPGSMLIIVTTPGGASGTAYELDKRFFGVDDPDTLVVHATVDLFHPALVPLSKRELELDPFRAPAEWLCQWISGLASFLDVPLVDSRTRNEPRELPRRQATATGTPIGYVGGLDVSGGRGDAAAAAVSHVERDGVIVDACRRWPAPHDPLKIAHEIAAFFKSYGITQAVADQYSAGFAVSAYGQAGMHLLPSDLSRSDVYLTLLPLLTTARCELPPDPTLRTELLGLERRTGPSGKDVVNHRPGAHDDLANAVALAAVAAARGLKSGSAEIWVAPSTALTNYQSELSPGWNPPWQNH